VNVRKTIAIQHPILKGFSVDNAEIGCKKEGMRRENITRKGDKQ
jgi:hypothetical protein